MCQRLATGLWFFTVSSTHKTGRHDLKEILFESGVENHTRNPVDCLILMTSRTTYSPCFFGVVGVDHLFSFLCCVFIRFLLGFVFFFVFILYLLYPILPVSLNCVLPNMIKPNMCMIGHLMIPWKVGICWISKMTTNALLSFQQRTVLYRWYRFHRLLKTFSKLRLG